MTAPAAGPHGAYAAPGALVDEIRRTLDGIGDPCSVAIRLRLTSPTCVMVSYFRIEAEERVLELPGVRSVEVVNDLGLDWSPEMMSPAAKARRGAALRARGIRTPA